MRYGADTIMDSYSIKCVLFPTYHKELNSIEWVWAYIISPLMTGNVFFNLKGILKLITNAMASVDSVYWIKSYQHMEEKSRITFYMMEYYPKRKVL